MKNAERWWWHYGYLFSLLHISMIVFQLKCVLIVVKVSHFMLNDLVCLGKPISNKTEELSKLYVRKIQKWKVGSWLDWTEAMQRSAQREQISSENLLMLSWLWQPARPLDLAQNWVYTSCRHRKTVLQWNNAYCLLFVHNTIYAALEQLM